MNRLAALLTLAVVLGTGLPVSAQGPAQIEFVRGLRAKYGPKLAEEYLQRLVQSPAGQNDPGLALEMARTKMELAANEPNNDQRIRLASEVQELLKKHTGAAFEAEARLINLRVANLQAKAMLARALRLETADAQQAEALRARPVIRDVGVQLQKAIQDLDAEQAKYKGDPKTPQEAAARKSLADAKLAAEFDLALNTLDEAQTMIVATANTSALLQRADLVKKALDQLDKVAARQPRGPLGWQARAWMVRAYVEKDEPRTARQRFEEVMKEREAYAEEGKRLALYFRLSMLLPVLEGHSATEPRAAAIAEAIQLGEQWQARYHDFLRTPDGYGVSFILAEAYYREAQNTRTDAVKRAEMQARARKLYGEVELTENDFATRAHQRKVELLLASQGGDPAKIESIDIASLNTFDELYLRAQFEAAQIGRDAEALKDKPEQLAARRQARLGHVSQALSRALTLAGAAGAPVNQTDLGDAEQMLAYSYLAAGDVKQAIRTGEALALKKPGSRQAPTGAIYALQAYKQVLSDPAAAGVPEQELDSYRQRLRDLAGKVIATWPHDLAADVARHQLGLLLYDEKKLPQAIEQLAAIQPSYGGLIVARYQLALWSFEADAAKVAPTATDADKRPWSERAVAALETLPALPEGADATTAQVYVLGRLRLGEVYYKARKFPQLQALSGPLRDAIDKGRIKLAPAVYKDLYPHVLSLRLFAAYGQADAEYTAGRYKQARELLGPVVADLQGAAYADVMARNADLRKNLLDLALRAEVLDGRGPQAVEVFQLMQKYGGEQSAGGAADLGPVLQSLSGQIQELRAQGKKEPAAAAEARCTAFLDELARLPGEPSPEFLRLLGQSYANVDQHGRAVELLRRVPAPTDNDARKLRNYQDCRVLTIHELRLAGKLDDAEAALKEAQKEPWAKDRLEVQKEALHLLDARGQHKEAYPGWNKLVKQLAGRIAEPRWKDLYFECYFHLVQSYYFYGKELDDAKRTDITRKSAGFILKLEAAWPDLGGAVSQARFMKLMEKEAPLKQEYDLQKKAR